MKTMIMIYADEGKILTDGEIYGTTISLEQGRRTDEFHEITQAEYEEILKLESEDKYINESN